MKSRTLTSVCQSPGFRPAQADPAACVETFFCDAVAVISRSLMYRRAGSGEPEQPARVPGNHQFLVGWNDPRLHAARRGGDARTVPLVRCIVEVDAEPGRRVADAAADLGGVLADAGREHETVDATEHGRERADFLGGAIDEVVDREPG